MHYPRRIIRIGEADARVVAALKKRLNQALGAASDPALKLDPANPAFGIETKRAVMLFQARNVDEEGRPLRQDGEVGSITWAALFGAQAVAEPSRPPDALLDQVLRLASAAEAKPVREQPRNSNRGPEVDEYLRRAGASLGLAWCCAFIYHCFDEAALAQGRPNPMVKTAGCLDHWNRAPSKGAIRILARDAHADPALVKVGMVFIMDYGGGLGHTGLIESTAGGMLTTIEGNTDASKTREGGGVYRLTRKVGEVNRGFIDYAGL